MNRAITLKATGLEIEGAISSGEYNRLLQIPRSRELEGDLLDRATKSRNWYASNGNPFVASRRIRIDAISSEGVTLEDGTRLSSAVLARRIRSGDGHAMIILAASAGTEVAEEVARHWAEGRPDEGYFLDRFAVAVTEHLVFWAAATLCRLSEADQETVLPHLSPGCGQWDLSDQHNLMRLLAGPKMKVGPVRLLESGALSPQHSVLAAMGVTNQNISATPESLCRSCDLSPCKFRRAPYSGATLHLLEVQ